MAYIDVFKGVFCLNDDESSMCSLGKNQKILKSIKKRKQKQPHNTQRAIQHFLCTDWVPGIKANEMNLNIFHLSRAEGPLFTMNGCRGGSQLFWEIY